MFLPGESPWTEEPGGLQSMESRRVRQDCTTKQSPAQQSIHYMDKREEFSSVHFFVRIICACIMSIVSKLQCFFIFNFCSLRGLSSSVCVCLVAQSCPTLCDPMDCSLPDSSVHGDSPGKNTGVGFHALLQGIFPTQGLNPGLLNCRWIL